MFINIYIYTERKPNECFGQSERCPSRKMLCLCALVWGGPVRSVALSLPSLPSPFACAELEVLPVCNVALW